MVTFCRIPAIVAWRPMEAAGIRFMPLRGGSGVVTVESFGRPWARSPEGFFGLRRSSAPMRRRLLLVLAALLPGLACGVLAGGVASRGQRAAVEADLQGQARIIALAMDQEIAIHLEALEALATLAEPD